MDGVCVPNATKHKSKVLMISLPYDDECDLKFKCCGRKRLCCLFQVSNVRHISARFDYKAQLESHVSLAASRE